MGLTKQKSSSVSQTDRRVARTRQNLDTAFVTLLHRRSYLHIRVSDIARQAGVGRATFYAHYSSKGDLLRSQFSRIVAPMLVARRRHPCPVDATALLIHVRTAPWIYKSLMRGQGSKILRECLEQRIAQFAAPTTGVPPPVVAKFVVSSLLTIIECWLETGALEPPEAMEAIFSGLVGNGLVAYHDGAAIGGRDTPASTRAY
jgi:AcrR family transcriptional regulator